jgi:hypothetical protein
MLCWYFTGMADEKELLAHIARLQNRINLPRPVAAVTADQVYTAQK